MRLASLLLLSLAVIVQCGCYSYVRVPEQYASSKLPLKVDRDRSPKIIVMGEEYWRMSDGPYPNPVHRGFTSVLSMCGYSVYKVKNQEVAHSLLKADAGAVCIEIGNIPPSGCSWDSTQSTLVKLKVGGVLHEDHTPSVNWKTFLQSDRPSQSVIDAGLGESYGDFSQIMYTRAQRVLAHMVIAEMVAAWQETGKLPAPSDGTRIDRRELFGRAAKMIGQAQ